MTRKFTSIRFRDIAGLALITLASLASFSVSANHAVLTVSSGTTGGCYNLFAGQTIDAGDVCYSVEGSFLKVVYTTQGDWRIEEAHLWWRLVLDEHNALFPYED